MSIALQMIQVNEPLHTWRTFKSDGRGTHISKENSRKIARAILKQCGHPAVIELISKEFEAFPESLRRDISDLANTAEAASGNVRKGLQRINAALNGRLLREQRDVVFNKRVETIDGVKYKTILVDQAKAGAMRKYGLI